MASYARFLLRSSVFCFLQAYSSPKEDPGLSMAEKKLIMGGNVSKEPVTNIPWKLILSKAPVWALIISHFCHNWGTFILLTWMPTYYNQVHSVAAASAKMWPFLPGFMFPFAFTSLIKCMIDGATFMPRMKNSNAVISHP